MESQEATMLAQYLFQKTEKKENIYFKEYENEYRGQVQIIVVELEKENIKDLKHYLNIRYKGDMEEYKRERIINWEKLKAIREEQIQDMILYNIERYYQYELERYEKTTKTKVG